MPTDNEYLRLLYVNNVNGVANNRDIWRSLTLTAASSSQTGAGLYWSVPSGKEWQFQTAYLQFTTNSTAANRALAIYDSNVSGTIAQSYARLVQTASQSLYYNIGLYPSLDLAVNTQYIYIPMPPLILAAGEAIGFTVDNRQSGDTFTAPILKVMERSLL